MPSAYKLSPFTQDSMSPKVAKMSTFKSISLKSKFSGEEESAAKQQKMSIL